MFKLQFWEFPHSIVHCFGTLSQLHNTYDEVVETLPRQRISPDYHRRTEYKKPEPIDRSPTMLIIAIRECLISKHECEKYGVPGTRTQEQIPYPLNTSFFGFPAWPPLFFFFFFSGCIFKYAFWSLSPANKEMTYPEDQIRRRKIFRYEKDTENGQRCSMNGIDKKRKGKRK